MKSSGLRFGLSSCLLTLAGLVAGCSHATESEAAKPVIVRVVPVLERPVTEYTFFTGRTAAVDSVDVRARVTGYLDSFDFKPGEDVKKNQRLFKIDPRPYQADYDKAQGQVSLAAAQLKLAIADYARSKAIARSPGAISQEDLDKSLASQEESQASLSAARANSESASLNLKFTDVLSPIDGVVGRNFLTVGNLVTQDSTLLTTIVSLDPMYGYFDVDERTLLRVHTLFREGKIKAKRQGEIQVELGLANEEDRYPHQGMVDFVNTQIDPSTGTIQLRGVFPNPASTANVPRLLTPGMFIRVRVPIGDPHPALLVPQASIGRDQGRKYLMVLGANNVVEYRTVDLGPEQPGGLQVVEPVKVVRGEDGLRAAASGEQGEDSLKAGEQVIVSGLQRVRPGLTVEPKPLEAAPK
jgi:membrane fusion protein, multidrug efflux system